MLAENYQLVVRRGPKPGQVYPLLAPTITVGRDPMSDIVLNDPEVSRYHAQLVETTDGYQIQDMGSTNGTYVAGQRISDDPVLLQPGQDVAFGSGIFLMYETTGDETNSFDDDPFDDNLFEDDVKLETAVSQPINSLPNEAQNPPPQYEHEHSPPLPSVPLSDEEEAAHKRKRLITIVVAVIALLCLCCILFVFVMYQWGGDWIIQQLQEQAALVVPQLLA